MTWRTMLVALNLLLVLAWLGLGIWNNETIIRQGERVLLEMRPVDPRSLMQGDYMALDYPVLARTQGFPPRGKLIASYDHNRVLTAIRYDDGTRPLAENELVMRYRLEYDQVWVVSETFFFQEGSGPRFSAARYAELRVGPNGTVILVGLLDERGLRIEPSLEK